MLSRMIRAVSAHRRAVTGAGAASLMALSACTTGLPADLPADSYGQFQYAVASVGCEMTTEKDFQPVELQTGLDREQVTQLLQYALANDDAERLPGGGIRLTTGPCQI